MVFRNVHQGRGAFACKSSKVSRQPVNAVAVAVIGQECRETMLQ